MVRILMGILFKIREVGQRWFMGIFEKFRGPDGKILGISPKGIQILVFTILSVFFLGIVATQLFDTQSSRDGGLEKFQKEMVPKTGLGDTEAGNGVIIPNDPLKNLSINANDPLSDFLKKGKKDDGKILDDLSNVDAQGNIIPDLSQCLDLIDKMKRGTVLSTEEQKTADTCIDQNIAQLSQEELSQMKALLEENKAKAASGASSVTPPSAMENILRKSLSGDLEDGSLEARIADLVKQGKLEEAQAAAAALEAKNRELAEAIAKRAEGDALSEREKALLSAYDKMMVGPAGPQGAPGTSGVSGVDGEATARQLAQQIAEREQRLKAMNDELAQNRALAAEAAKKLAEGKDLAEAEKKALEKMAELQRQKDAEMAAQKKQQEALAKLMSSMRDTMARISATMNQVYPSGITLVNFDEDDCGKKPLAYKKVGKKGVKKAPVGDVVLGLDGKPLTPDKIKLLRLYQKNKAMEDKSKLDALKPDNSFVTTGQRLAEASGEEVQRQDVTSLFVFTNKALKEVNLTANMKIPGVLDSMILVSDKGNPQIVRIRILEDVRNPDNNVIVFPKGAIAIAKTSGFDAETGVMDFAVTKVIVGSGKTIEVRLNVGSADGTMGLKGQIRDTRGKYLLGAFITSFTAGALNWFSQQIVQPFQDSTNTGDALTGAGLAGGAEVMTKISEMYAQDLQGAARIYYAPKGVPIVLFPE